MTPVEQDDGMTTPVRRVVVLAPMPLEHKAVTAAFGLRPADPNDKRGRWVGTVGPIAVTSLHIGMGPPATRAAVSRLLDEGVDGAHVDHVMIAGICGGLDPEVDVGTLINPEIVTDHTSGVSYRHSPPGDAPRAGKLLTTEGVTLDLDLVRRQFEDGYVAVDMETSAVAEICEPRGCPWSAYRCIGDRPYDGLIDERLLAMTNPDGSGNHAEIERLLAAEPELVRRLEQLGRDAAAAAQRAAEAAFQACRVLGAP